MDSSESDSNSEDEKLLDAVDPNFKKIMFTNSESKLETTSKSQPNEICSEVKKSNRPKSLEDDFSKPYSLVVSNEAQQFIKKKLDQALESCIEDVICSNRSLRKPKNSMKLGIHLFKDSANVVRAKDLITKPIVQSKQTKPVIKKRKHIDGSDSESEEQKLQKVAVSAAWVLSNHNY